MCVCACVYDVCIMCAWAEVSAEASVGTRAVQHVVQQHARSIEKQGHCWARARARVRVTGANPRHHEPTDY